LINIFEIFNPIRSNYKEVIMGNTQKTPIGENSTPLGIRSIRVLLFTSISLIVALIFPPHYMILQDVGQVGYGFQFIIQTRSGNQVLPLVFAPQLFAEIFVILMVGFMAWIWARNADMIASSSQPALQSAS
jgi:hypothetical protein